MWGAIQWIEEPPKWDVFNIKSLKGTISVGKIVQAPFEGKMLDVKLVALGKV